MTKQLTRRTIGYVGTKGLKAATPEAQGVLNALNKFNDATDALKAAYNELDAATKKIPTGEAAWIAALGEKENAELLNEIVTNFTGWFNPMRTDVSPVISAKRLATYLAKL